jgi:hypothetical protein
VCGGADFGAGTAVGGIACAEGEIFSGSGIRNPDAGWIAGHAGRVAGWLLVDAGASGGELPARRPPLAPHLSGPGPAAGRVASLHRLVPAKPVGVAAGQAAAEHANRAIR